eukprot:12503928-Prorocentrum_lima.AAC.1
MGSSPQGPVVSSQLPEDTGQQTAVQSGLNLQGVNQVRHKGEVEHKVDAWGGQCGGEPHAG